MTRDEIAYLRDPAVGAPEDGDVESVVQQGAIPSLRDVHFSQVKLQTEERLRSIR